MVSGKNHVKVKSFLKMTRVKNCDISQSTIEEYNRKHEANLKKIEGEMHSKSWNFQKRDGNMELYNKYLPDNPMIQTLTIINLPIPKEAMIDVMTYDKVYTLQDTPQGPIPPKEIYALYYNRETQDTLYYMQMERPMKFVAERSFFVYRRRYVRNDCTIFMQMSIDNDNICPQVEGVVRGTIYGQAFEIKDGQKENTCVMTVYNHCTPGGSLPAFAVNASVKNQVDGLKYITQAAIEYWNKKNH